MRKLLTCTIILLLLASIACIGTKQRRKNFVTVCFDENFGREALSMSQIGLLYDGVRKFEDDIARQTLIKNCPRAARKYRI